MTHMNKEDATKYMANIARMMLADGRIDPIEEVIFDEVAREIGAGYFQKKEGRDLASAEDFDLPMVTRLSDRIRNLEDMLFMAYCNDELDPGERDLVIDFAKRLEISQAQLEEVRLQTKQRYTLFKKDRA